MTSPYRENLSLIELPSFIQELTKTQPAVGVLLLDVVNYASLLHIFGRPAASGMIRLALKSLQSSLPKGMQLLSVNDHQAWIIVPVPNPRELQILAKDIYNYLLHYGAEFSEQPLHLLCHIGGVLINADMATERVIQEMLDKAYMALDYTDASASKYYCFYGEISQQQQHAKNQMLLAHCMQKAIMEERLRLAFQPVIHSQTGMVAYHECLLRIVTDEGKIISAGPFIPIAEMMGFIHLIDILVLEKVVEELKQSPQLILSFNLSSLGINNTEWLERAQTLLSDETLAKRVIVEITETAIQRDLPKAAFVVATLQNLGCQVALDDFGAGHTSFKQLRVLPIDIIKIDGSFIRDIVDNQDNRLFVKTLLEISRGFGLHSVAEFVETGETAKMLMELKVDYMQGNYFCPAVNYRSWMQESQE